jgi:hypothetical protein
MTTFINFPIEINSIILKYIGRSYWAFFGLTCSDYQAILRKFYDVINKDISNNVNKDASKNVGKNVSKNNNINNHMMQMKIIIQDGHLDLIKYISRYYKLNRKISIIAGKHGRLEMLKWMREQNDYYYWGWKICAYAARNGHLETLKWCHDNGCELNNEDISTYAAENGQLEILKWSFRSSKMVP